MIPQGGNPTAPRSAATAYPCAVKQGAMRLLSVPPRTFEAILQCTNAALQAYGALHLLLVLSCAVRVLCRTLHRAAVGVAVSSRLAASE